MATSLINYDNVHVVCESSYLGATYGDGRILSMKYEEDLDNGKVVVAGDYLGAEVYEAEEPATGDAVYLVLTTPAHPYDYTKAMQSAEYFYNAKGDAMRCYPLNKKDVFTISEDGIEAISESTALAKGQFVIADGVDLKAVATAPTANGFIGKIIEVVRKSNGMKYRVEVIKNETVVAAASAPAGGSN